jgi:hypothetical protein
VALASLRPSFCPLVRPPGSSCGEAGEIEISLVADGDQTLVVWEERGMPVELLAAYGAGVQLHVEDLRSYLAGGGRCDADARWKKLSPAYQQMAADVR